MSTTTRPAFPKRAIITGGMPYGNKELHFGHIGGVFIQADIFNRFLQDRIGPENVIFVSGTDCYGSPIVEYHRQKQESGEFTGTLNEFVQYNHEKQKQTLENYNIDISQFAASGLGKAAQIHQEISALFFTTLLQNGHLQKLSTHQFFDVEANTYLNGRQVIGQCPIQGCRSQKAYADECELGHQYMPRDLLFPKSALTGKKPELREVANWYINLPNFSVELEKWIEKLQALPETRRFVISYIKEFFHPPVIHVPKKQLEDLQEILPTLPPHSLSEGQKKSMTLTFKNLDDREKACDILAKNALRFRTGKTLVPFRLSGNIEWGVPVPQTEKMDPRSFWVWPESLWAPISFTAAYLESLGQPKENWKQWWCTKDSMVYQFIGEDNVYFYGPAEMALFFGMQGTEFSADPAEGQLQIPKLVVNHHLLFLKSKASSSGKVKPPMAHELLNHYTPDQLRAHFCSLGLGFKSIGFRPKPFNPKANEREPDPVLKEGKLLTNVLNRVARTAFYTIQKYTDGRIPVGKATPAVVEQAKQTILDYEHAMYVHTFHKAFGHAEKFIRDINKHWGEVTKGIDLATNQEVRDQALIDVFYMLRVATVLMHPIAPTGCEKVLSQLNLGSKFWQWEYIFEDLYFFMEDPQNHQPEHLPPRTDFFERHPSQF